MAPAVPRPGSGDASGRGSGVRSALERTGELKGPDRPSPRLPWPAVARRDLYLHEVVDIVGQGQYDYMEHLRSEPTNAMADMLTLQGSFFVCAMGGGRWPQVVNIWDVGERGWDAWAANVDRLNLKRRTAFYRDWWDEAAQWRRGGFDRLSGGDAGQPRRRPRIRRRRHIARHRVHR